MTRPSCCWTTLDNTFTTPVFNGSTSLRDAAGQLIEDVTKAERRHQEVSEESIQQLYADTTALYHLDSTSATGGGKTELGSPALHRRGAAGCSGRRLGADFGLCAGPLAAGQKEEESTCINQKALEKRLLLNPPHFGIFIDFSMDTQYNRRV